MQMYKDFTPREDLEEHIKALIDQGRKAAQETDNDIYTEDVLYIYKSNENIAQRMVGCYYMGVAVGLSIATSQQDGKALQ